MKVFISWSGDLSFKIAQSICEWLPQVIQAVEPYLSSEMDKGAKWQSEISTSLEDSVAGIICLTRENLTAPWIHFELGALQKKFEKPKVCPILFGLTPSEVRDPIAMFQLTEF